MPPINSDLFKQALDTAHDGCKDTACVHADAEIANLSAIEQKIGQGVMSPLFLANPMLSCFSLGLHVGYRLHQLESEPLNTETAN